MDLCHHIYYHGYHNYYQIFIKCEWISSIILKLQYINKTAIIYFYILIILHFSYGKLNLNNFEITVPNLNYVYACCVYIQLSKKQNTDSTAFKFKKN